MNNAIQHSERPLRNIVWQTPTAAAPWAHQDDAMTHGLRAALKRCVTWGILEAK